MNPIPKIDQVFSLILQEETQKEVRNESIVNDIAKAYAITSAKSGAKNEKKDRPLCAHYGILGHTKDKCFKLHGYPPGHKKFQAPTSMNHVFDSAEPVQFTPQLCHQLMALLQSRMTRTSGAQDQMTFPKLIGQSAIEEDWQG